jgi:hypothetical protein
MKWSRSTPGQPSFCQRSSWFSRRTYSPRTSSRRRSGSACAPLKVVLFIHSPQAAPQAPLDLTRGEERAGHSTELVQPVPPGWPPPGEVGTPARLRRRRSPCACIGIGHSLAPLPSAGVPLPRYHVPQNLAGASHPRSAYFRAMAANSLIPLDVVDLTAAMITYGSCGPSPRRRPASRTRSSPPTKRAASTAAESDGPV